MYMYFDAKMYIQFIKRYANTAKYLGMTLDTKLWWKEHIKKKRDELIIKFRKMYWLLGRNSELSIYNKLILYKQVLRPVWSYGIQLWDCASDSTLPEQNAKVYCPSVLVYS
jgi:hypothetical protein